jgi:hypothetical protein
VPWLMKSTIPPPWQMPLPDISFSFGTSLVTMFYGPGLIFKVRGGTLEREGRERGGRREGEGNGEAVLHFSSSRLIPLIGTTSAAVAWKD